MPGESQSFLLVWLCLLARGEGSPSIRQLNPPQAALPQARQDPSSQFWLQGSSWLPSSSVCPKPLGLLAVLRNIAHFPREAPQPPAEGGEGERGIFARGGCHHAMAVGSSNSKNDWGLLVTKGRQARDWQCQLLVASETRAGLMEEAWELEAEAEEDQRDKGGDDTSAAGEAMAGQAAQLRDPVEMRA